MIADALLGRLDGVRQTGPGRWVAKCPAHDDRRPSLHIRELDDRCVVHCFGGCHVDGVLANVGMTVADLFPARLPAGVHTTPRAPRIPAGDILRAVAHEVHVAACAASELEAGRPLGAEDRERLSLCVRRLSVASEVANG